MLCKTTPSYPLESQEVLEPWEGNKKLLEPLASGTAAILHCRKDGGRCGELGRCFFDQCMQCKISPARLCTYFPLLTGLHTYEEEEEFFYRNLSEDVMGDDQLICLM